ncbi:MAG: hypothetical protein ACRDQ5_05480, partial [Sciscionella sp.]
WQYVEGDAQLREHWAGGAIAYYPGGVARNVVIGSIFTANGRRPVYLADSVHDGVTDFVLVAMRCRRRLEAYLELWLPSVPFRRDQMPDLLGPVGQRYAFVSDAEATRSLITSDLADAAEQVGGDVNVVWLEGYWVVAAAPPNCSSVRLERLLRDLGDLADLADPIEKARSAPAGPQSGDPQSGETERQLPSQPQATQSARAAQAAQASTQAGTANQATPSGQADPPTQRVNADGQRGPRRTEPGSQNQGTTG